MRFALLSSYLLFASAISLWIPFPIWPILLGLSVVSGLVLGQLTLSALVAILLFVMAFCLYRKIPYLGFLFIVAMSIALGYHLLPGFRNPKVLNNVHFSEDGIPFTLYWNFDKTLIGIFIIGLLHSRARTAKEWIGTLSSTLSYGLPIIFTVALISILVGFVRIDIKFPAELPLWASTNLLLVCLAEEGFFRGFLQRELTRHLPPIAAIASAACFFGLCHLKGGWTYVLLSTLGGIGYGWVYQKTGRIEASILVHFLLNLFHFIVLTYPALVP